MNAIQILGYAASLIVFISLMMKSLAKLRVLNAAGSLLFVVFALATDSLPTAFLNMGIVVIDVFYFIRMTRVKDNFEIMTVQKDNEVVRRFCRINKKELDALFGEASFVKSEKIALFFRNDDIAGLLAYSSVAASRFFRAGKRRRNSYRLCRSQIPRLCRRPAFFCKRCKLLERAGLYLPFIERSRQKAYSLS